jgi:hypothetical protein
VNQNTTIESANSSVQAVVEEITGQLHSLMQQRDEVVQRIGTVKKTIASLLRLFNDVPVSSELSELLGNKTPRKPGLSAECRLVLMHADRPLSAREVRDSVLDRLPALAHHRDSLASVTTVLNRLIRYGEACNMPDETGRHRWAWVTEQSSPSHHLESANLTTGRHPTEMHHGSAFTTS